MQTPAAASAGQIQQAFDVQSADPARVRPRAAQREPERHRSLRVRMGGWCAYFTMLSREQQDHHIRRQEARA